MDAKYVTELVKVGSSGLPYDLAHPFEITKPPIGFDEEPPIVPLIKREAKIAGYPVDFPLGLPASVLAANAQWIKFYARRGFDILTYKTVRTVYRPAHPWPNWVFIKDPCELAYPPDSVIGYRGYIPPDLTNVSMANSFGVPSLPPEWWQDDIRQARAAVREGHQVFIVSIISSVEETDERLIAEDFVKAAVVAKKAGADIIEANYSCPNVIGDKVGELFHSSESAARVSKIIKTALKDTFGEKAPPLFVKIGYLPEQKLTDFVRLNAEFIDGIVAINTISTKVVDEQGQETFPGRPTAGISGAAIRARAQEVARSLVSLKRKVFTDLKKELTVFGLGGVTKPEDAFTYLDNIGVDAVETCTAAFVNPNFGLEMRLDKAAVEKTTNSSLLFELKAFAKFLEEAAFHPKRKSRLRVDRRTRQVLIEET